MNKCCCILVWQTNGIQCLRSSLKCIASVIQKGSTFLFGFCCCIVGLSEEPCSSHLPASEDLAAVAEVSPSSSTSSISTDNDSLRQPEAEAEASTSETKEKAKTKRNRCFMCRKKVGLTGEYRVLVVL